MKLEQNKLVTLRLKILSAFGGKREFSHGFSHGWRGGDTYMYTCIHVPHVPAYQPHTIFNPVP